MKTGLVLEGGAMRALWSAGVTDVMMEHDVWPDALVGVSAGAAFGCNYKSRQSGRAVRYNMSFCNDQRYCGLRSLLTTGNYYNARFAYHTVPDNYDVFDREVYEENPMEFTAVVTDVSTGRAVYHQIEHMADEELDWLRASASMPVVSRIVRVGGMKLLDGGVADSIPLEYHERRGIRRNVVVLTQPQGFVKQPTPLMPLLRAWLWRHPRMVQALARRHEMYNRQLEYVARAEREGRALVIRPDGPIPIGHISHDRDQMYQVYTMGRAVGERHIDQIKRFYHEN